MANSLTYKGEETMLKGDGADGSIARLAVAVRLMDGSSTPSRDGTGFVEVANGNGYVTGGKAIVVGDWTYTAQLSKIVLADQVWTAAGGTIPSIRGAYIVDSANNVLAWWERSLLTLQNGDDLTLDDLTVQLG
jgi:hypothetical protein